MGAAGSTFDFSGKSVNSIVEKLMPLYYHQEAVTQDDIYVAENSWRVIIEGNSAMMKDMRSFTGLYEADGMDLYRELFFTRLFDIHESARPMFSEKAVRSGKFIGSVMQLCFDQLKHPKDFRRKIVALAESHCQMGIRTIEYGVIGEVLFWSLQKILGVDGYTRRVEEAWTKVFSSMLRIIVPIAVAFERDEGRFKRSAVSRAQAMSTFRNSAAGRSSIHAGTSANVVKMYESMKSNAIPEEQENEPSTDGSPKKTALPTNEADESVSVMVKR